MGCGLRAFEAFGRQGFFCTGMSLTGSQTPPMDCLRRIPEAVLTAAVTVAELELGFRIAFLGFILERDTYRVII